MPWVLIFHLWVVVQTPNGDRLLDFGRFPSKAWCEADRSELLTELRATNGQIGPGVTVRATGCISPRARIA
jgi:hypothetical protein